MTALQAVNQFKEKKEGPVSQYCHKIYSKMYTYPRHNF